MADEMSNCEVFRIVGEPIEFGNPDAEKGSGFGCHAQKRSEMSGLSRLAAIPPTSTYATSNSFSRLRRSGKSLFISHFFPRLLQQPDKVRRPLALFDPLAWTQVQVSLNQADIDALALRQLGGVATELKALTINFFHLENL